MYSSDPSDQEDIIGLEESSNSCIDVCPCYPGSPEGAAPVFITVNGPLSHAAVTKHLRRVVERAGIKRHITPHIFRHSRITHMIQKGMSESLIKKLM